MNIPASVTMQDWLRLRRTIATLVVGFAVHSAAAQPGNDVCGQNQISFMLPGMGGTVNGSFQNATQDAGSSSCGSAGVDVYYYFTPMVASSYTFSTCSSSSNINTVLSIHTGCPATTSNFVGGAPASACNDDFQSCGLRSQFDSPVLTAGVPIVIRVARLGMAMSNFTLTVTPGVPNNTCGQNQAAFTIPGGGGSVIGTLAQATEDSPGLSICGNADVDVFYYFTPTTTASHRFSTCTSGADTNTLISIHYGCPATTGNYYGGSSNACSSNVSGCTNGSQLDSSILNAGSPVVIRVSERGGGANPFTLTVTPNPTGACCDNVTGSCVSILLLDCSGDRLFFAGAGVSCGVGVCPQPGACCDNSTSGSCISRTVNGCDLGHSFRGAGTVCAPNPCPQPGACCDLVSGACLMRVPSGCAAPSVFQAQGELCTPNPCVGVCCSPAGGCITEVAGSCAAPSRFLGAGTSCSPTNICPSSGGGFTLVWFTMDGGGTTPAAPNVGTPVGGAPIRLSGTIGQPDCGPASFTGGGFTLRDGFWPGIRNCPADFNGSGAVSVQDIFDFLAAWFAGQPSADFNESGGVTVQDIFAFLAAWFTGC